MLPLGLFLMQEGRPPHKRDKACLDRALVATASKTCSGATAFHGWRSSRVMPEEGLEPPTRGL